MTERCACTTFRRGLLIGRYTGSLRVEKIRRTPCGPVRYAVRSPTVTGILALTVSENYPRVPYDLGIMTGAPITLQTGQMPCDNIRPFCVDVRSSCVIRRRRRYMYFAPRGTFTAAILKERITITRSTYHIHAMVVRCRIRSRKLYIIAERTRIQSYAMTHDNMRCHTCTMIVRRLRMVMRCRTIAIATHSTLWSQWLIVNQRRIFRIKYHHITTYALWDQGITGPHATFLVYSSSW